MVVSADVIKRNSVLHVTWIFATGDSQKLSRKEVLGQKVPNICDSIIEMVPEPNGSVRNKAGLYLLSLLTYGTVLLHRYQVDFLQKDVERLRELLRKKSFVMLMAETFDRNQAELRKQERRAGKLRSQPIASIEEIDTWVNLADLNMISENLGINGDVRDFTMMDALPNPPLSWTGFNADNTGLYGSIDQFSNNKNVTQYSTFVEGNGSDERERLTDAVFDFQPVPVDKSPHDMPQKRSIHDEPRKRSIHQIEFEERPQELIDEFLQPVEKQPSYETREDTLKYVQCNLSMPPEDMQPDSLFERPQENTLVVRAETPLVQLEEPQGPQLQNQDKEPSEQLQNPNPPQEEPFQEMPQQLPQEPFQPIEELDFPNVSRVMQEQVTAFYEQVANLPEDSVALPPPPQDDFDLPEQPPSKKQRLTDAAAEEELERARKRPSSRPMTPVTPLNRTDLTTLQTTIRTENGEEELSFHLDSQIRDPLPPKKVRRRNLPPIYGDDLEIDASVQKALLADWTSLVRNKEDVTVRIPLKTHSVSTDMFLPTPFFGLGKHISTEFCDVFRTGIYIDYAAKVAEEPSEEDQLKYATVSLLPSPEDLQQMEEEQRTRLFDEEYRPLFEELHRQPAPFPEQQPEPIGPQYMFTQVDLRPSSPLEEENRPEATVETLKFASTTLLPSSSETMKFAQTVLLPTPEKMMEARIIEDLQLEPLPVTNVMDTLDYSARRQTMHQSEDMENPRHRSKSSMGHRPHRVEELEQGSEEHAIREKTLNQEKTQFSMNFVEEDPFVFSSGSLLPNNRFQIHEELLTETREKYPEWVDFNKFTATFTRKKAATSFEGLLLGLKNMKLRAEQVEPFGTIRVQHLEEPMFNETQ